MRPGFDPWVRKIPWRRTWQPTPVFFLGNPMGRGAWPIPLEEDMATHSSVLSGKPHGQRSLAHEVTKSQIRLSN